MCELAREKSCYVGNDLPSAQKWGFCLLSFDCLVINFYFEAFSVILRCWMVLRVRNNLLVLLSIAYHSVDTYFPPSIKNIHRHAISGWKPVENLNLQIRTNPLCTSFSRLGRSSSSSALLIFVSRKSNRSRFSPASYFILLLYGKIKTLLLSQF